jgi:hypothetical protein
MIDTLKLANRLTDAGMDRKQAEALAESLKTGLDETAVTKRDLELLESRLSNKLYGMTVTVILALGIIQHFFK